MQTMLFSLSFVCPFDVYHVFLGNLDIKRSQQITRFNHLYYHDNISCNTNGWSNAYIIHESFGFLWFAKIPKTGSTEFQNRMKSLPKLIGNVSNYDDNYTHNEQLICKAILPIHSFVAPNHYQLYAQNKSKLG